MLHALNITIVNTVYIIYRMYVCMLIFPLYLCIDVTSIHSYGFFLLYCDCELYLYHYMEGYAPFLKKKITELLHECNLLTLYTDMTAVLSTSSVE